MIEGINKVIILGKVVSDPDLKYTSSNSSFISIIISTKSTFKNKLNDNLITKIEWHKVVLFGKIAESISNDLKKGSIVYLEGSIRTNKWQDKNGISRYNVDIIASLFKILDLNNDIHHVDDSYDHDKNFENKSNKSFFENDIDF